MSTRIQTLSRAGVVLALLIAVLVLPTLAAAAGPCTTICYVNGTTGNDANDGDTPATAKQTIQAAVNQVTAGGQVIVAAGTYIQNITINKSLTLTGAGQTDDASGTVIDGSTLSPSGYGISVNAGVTDVTIESLRVEDFDDNPSSGIWAWGQNDRFTVQNVTADNNGFAGNSGGGIYMNGPVDDVLIDHVTATGNRTRGIVIWNGFKTHITLTNNTVTGNNCCGIELQDGTAGGVTATGNTVTGNLDSGMAFIGLRAGAGPNVIANNTLTDNGRFGIEIKLPNGTGATSGDGSIVVEDNTISMSAALADGPGRDGAGISAYRRGWVAGNNNVDIPTGVVIRNNTVSGYQQTSTSDGFGIVVEGTNMTVSGNTLTNNDVGVQVQAGHLPYTANTNIDGFQNNLADTYFGRGNSPVGCANVGTNTFSGNGVNVRNVGAGGGVVTNTNTGETFCGIQAAIDDSDTVNGHTIVASPGVYAENVVVNKSLTINGANAGVSPNDPVNPLNPNGARGPESEVTVTGGAGAFRVGAANVTIDGFKFTDAAVDLAHVQSPIIGAGGNFGGDAPGVKVLNNLFFETNRMLVYFNGPVLMQGGTIDDNRAQNPGRPDTGCGTAPAAAPSNCAHQLFNPWSTQNLSFQRNVTIAAPANGDRMRTLNLFDSVDITIADNTIRYTCMFTCFNIASGAGGDVTMTGNDAVTDAGNVLQIHSTWTTLGANINVHHNTFTTGNDYPIAIDDLNADLDNVHINRNALIGGLHVRNGALPSSPGAETLDVTCNWWGSAAGPNPANFFGPSDFDPWLSSSNLNGPCAISGYLFSAEMPGTVDGVTYGSEDVLRYDPVTDDWSVWFDGSAHNLIAKKNTHNINGIYVPDPSQPAFYLTFTQNKRVVPGVGQKVDGMDIVYWNGTAYSLFFDGSDVGLTNLTKEKIDAFDILPGNMSPINGGACMHYILVSMQNSGSVPNYSGGQLKFSGEDVLGFCMTASGTVTAGKWHMWLDGSTQGMQAQSTNNIDVSADAQMLYFTTHKNFNADTAIGNHSMIYVYDVASQSFSGPIFKAADHGFTGKTDAMQLIFD